MKVFHTDNHNPSSSEPNKAKQDARVGGAILESLAEDFTNATSSEKNVFNVS